MVVPQHLAGAFEGRAGDSSHHRLPSGSLIGAQWVFSVPSGSLLGAQWVFLVPSGSFRGKLE